MKLHTEIGSLRRLMEGEVKAGERAVQESVRAAGVGLKTAWRGQITGSGLGQRLARTIREQSYPKGGASLNAASLVWSKAPEIVAAHDAGPLIRAKNGLWLAIPLEAAGRGRGGKRPTPAEWEQRTGMTLQVVHRRGRNPLLVAEGRVSKAGRAVASRSKTGRGLQSVPVFTLVRQVSLRKRLDLERPAQTAIAGLPAAIGRNWSNQG